MQFTGKTVFVTGGTSGVGKETAKAFAERGGSVVLTGRDAQRGKGRRRRDPGRQRHRPRGPGRPGPCPAPVTRRGGDDRTGPAAQLLLCGPTP